jgi:hypothetical protein
LGFYKFRGLREGLRDSYFARVAWYSFGRTASGVGSMEMEQIDGRRVSIALRRLRRLYQ